MNQAEYERFIEELDALITDTCQLIARFEETGVGDKLPDDYARLEMIISQALKERRFYMQQILDSTDSKS